MEKLALATPEFSALAEFGSDFAVFDVGVDHCGPELRYARQRLGAMHYPHLFDQIKDYLCTCTLDSYV
ncbi:MAG: hypothetical protein O2960_23905 [Verrucomicrobia bacterium]|nr:hypothetical protein [Verrucomicrobiota bacterium]